MQSNVHELKREYEAKIREMIKNLAPAGTTFNWSRAKKRFGCCVCSWRKNSRGEKEFYKFRITISEPIALLNSWEDVRKTVIHEIAHANTPGHHHDWVWQQECVRLGGDGKRCYKDENRGGTVKLPETKKWEGTCPVCGKVVVPTRMRRRELYHACINNTQHLLLVWTELAG